MPGSSLISSIMEAELVMNGKRANERTIALEWKIKDELRMNYINLESEWRPSGKVIHYKLFRTLLILLENQSRIILFCLKTDLGNFSSAFKYSYIQALSPVTVQKLFKLTQWNLSTHHQLPRPQEGSSPEAYLTATNDIRVLIKNSVIYNISTNI